MVIIVKKITALLSIIICMQGLISCGDEPTKPTQNPTDTKKTDEVVTAPAETLSENQMAVQDVLAKLVDTDYQGYEFRILDRDSNSGVFETVDVWYASEDGDVIHDAVYQRNRHIEESMNIKVVEIKAGEPYVTARIAILAGEDAYDTLTDGLTQMSTLAVEGHLYDLADVASMKMDQPWWDQEMRQDLSIANHVFFCTGDISIMDNYGTWCILFNKDLANEYDIDDLYTHVREGTWTLDLMYDISKTVYKDIDGNSTVDGTDQFGFLTETFNGYGLWAAGGNTITAKDGNDFPVLNMNNEHSADVFNKVMEFMKDPSATMLAEKNGGTGFMNQQYSQGRGLFIYGGMWLISHFRDSDINFGIIPAPKFDESQDRYYNTYSYKHCTAYALPITATEPERSGAIMEAMAEVSRYTLTPAYYEVALKRKFAQDEESAEMLDIILSQRAYDLGMIFNWGTMFTMIDRAGTQSKSDYVSGYERRESKALKEIADFIEQLENLD